MSAIEADLPSVILQGEELEEVWDRMMSLSNSVMNELGVEVIPVHEEVTGDYKRIRFAA